MSVLGIITLFLSVFYGVAIGTNDAANSFGDWIGARVGKPRFGLLLCGIFAFIGAVLEGGKVMKTIGGGIVPQKYLLPEIAMVGVISAIMWVFIASWFGMPVSTTHSVVGSVGGIGLSLILFQQMPIDDFNFKVVFKIILSWLTTPTGSMAISFILSVIVLNVIKNFSLERPAQKIAKIFLTFSSSYVAYTWGANDVANSVALLSASGIVSSKTAVIIGGTSIAIGAIFFGYKVAETVGLKITRLTPVLGVCADISTALTIHFFTELRMPVSTTHALVGAIFGVGFARGVNIVNFKIMKDIVLAWVLTPVVSGFVTFLVFTIFKLVNLI